MVFYQNPKNEINHVDLDEKYDLFDVFTFWVQRKGILKLEEFVGLFKGLLQKEKNRINDDLKR